MGFLQTFSPATASLFCLKNKESRCCLRIAENHQKFFCLTLFTNLQTSKTSPEVDITPYSCLSITEARRGIQCRAIFVLQPLNQIPPLYLHFYVIFFC